MKLKKNPFHLFNKALLLAIALLVVQQLIVASSTVWITRLIADLQKETFSYSLLALYLASLFLPYLPGGAALIKMARAKIEASLEFMTCFALAYRGQVVEWTDSSKKGDISSILTAEAPETIHGWFDYVYELIACGLNVAFNLLVLMWILDSWLLVAYAIGVLFAFFILKLQKRRKKTLSLQAQQGRIKWVSILLKAWDNILLDNSHNFCLWQTKKEYLAKELSNSTVKLARWSQGISIAMAFVLLGPAFLFICYFPLLHGGDFTQLAMMIVALPRMFQVLSYCYEMLFLLADVPMQRSKLETVVKLLEPKSLLSEKESIETLKKRIDWAKIQVFLKKESLSPETFLEQIQTQDTRKGRYTVRGENGSGKSSLLLLFKAFKRANAFYLPAKHDLVFAFAKQELSTGQRARKILEELLDHVEAPLLLLDEWDANLDQANEKQLSELIDKLSEKRCVIEVRH